LRSIAICLIALAACTQTSVPIAIHSVDIPNIIRAGSPFRVTGFGLSGAAVRLQFADRSIDAHLQTARQGAEGETAEGLLPEVDLPDQSQLIQLCLTTPSLSGWQHCASISATWQKMPQATIGQVDDQQIALGQWIDLPVTDALLPSEGQTWLQTLENQMIQTQVTWQKGQRQVRFLADTTWLGVQPGKQKRQIRLNLQSHGQTLQGPWLAVDLTVQAPQLLVLQGALRRGDKLPLQITGVPDDGSAQLHWHGVWQTQSAGSSGLLDLQLPLGATPTLPSAWRFAKIPLNAVHFDGDIRLQLQTASASWQGPAQAVSWPLLPTIQHVQVLMGQEFLAGLARLGLQAHAAAISARTVAILAQHFAQFSCQFGLEPPATAVEYLRIAVLDRDPNGQHLFGADSSFGKDVGNLVLDEQLRGYDWSAALAGEIAYGGVFIGEFLEFSRILHPNSSQSSSDFDAIFGPFAADLAGAATTNPQSADLAIETLAQLIAHTAAHEIGHALGLASGTAAYHHSGDNPGWIMDNGIARDFAERAALPGATAQTWGPVDTPYLKMILPKP